MYARAAKGNRDYGMLMDESFKAVDEKQVLTSLGRRQAEATGIKLAEILAPALTTPGRESHVRLHCSSLARARETCDVIASHLPSNIRRLPPDPNLAEGWPLAHRIPYPEGAPQSEARSVHVEGARIEAAFRSLFYRAMPPTQRPPPPCGDVKSTSSGGKDGGGANKDGSIGGGAGGGVLGGGRLPSRASAPSSAQRRVPRHEYDIVVCHGNVIRYFVLRAIQCPPEAWLRLCTFNCSISHVVIHPNGGVSLNSIGDVGHLKLEETTFSMHEGYEW